MKNDQKTIGSRIKQAREDLNMSQLELATDLGFQSATAISLIEADERGVPAAMLEELGKILHKDIKYFLGQEEGKKVDVQVALRADKDLSAEDKEAISHFIELAKNKKNSHGK
jgi:transcriptional regulator with XRE-family HTH domain